MEILVSHSSKDALLVKELKSLLEKASLDRIKAWHSSDDSAEGGIDMGDTWFSRLMKQLHSTDVVLALITPNSITSGWLYFESGIGAALKDTIVIPVIVGLRVEEVGMPLTGYQVYSLANTSTLTTFTKNILSIAGVPFVDDLHNGLIESSFSSIKKLEAELYASSEESQNADFFRALDALALRIETRIRTIADKIPETGRYGGTFSVNFAVYQDGTDDLLSEFRILIEPGWSLGRFLDECYYALGDFVSPYKYTETWIIYEQETQTYLAAMGLALHAPAEVFFKPQYKYEIRLLSVPYDHRVDLNAYSYNYYDNE